MLSKSSLQRPARYSRAALWRALWVMLMAFIAYAVLSGSPVDAQTATPAAGNTADAHAAPAALASDVPDATGTTVWAEVYESVTRLADAGSAAAARLALQMHRLGPSVYGVAFEASESQLRRWQWQVECVVCESCAGAG